MEESKKNGTSKIVVIGIDASGVDNLSILNQKLLLSSARIAAPSRIIDSLESWWYRNISLKDSELEIFSTDKLKKLIQWLRSSNEKTIILSSGDPLWFGIGRTLLENFTSKEIEFRPSPTSLQLACAKISRPWQDASWISLHGRDPQPLAALLLKRPKTLAILTDPNRGGANEVRVFLKSMGLEQYYSFWIFEKLGHPEERINQIFPESKIPNNLDDLHMVLLIKQERSEINTKNLNLPLFGIEDGTYLQHEDVPGLMTKKEARIQIIADLNLPKTGVLWDLGAGVGSIGLESLRLMPSLKLISVEKRVGSSSIIRENASRLNVMIESIYEGDILEFLKINNIPNHLKNPDRVILGGGSKNRSEILNNVINRLAPQGIIVIPLATLQAVNEIEIIFKENNLLLEISQHQSYRGITLGEGTRLAPMNPVFILKGKKLL